MNVYEQAALLIKEANDVAAFTGAGISAESGIPTFRDPGGIWDQFDPEEFGTAQGIMSVMQRRPEVLREFLLNSVDTFQKAKINGAHRALAELEGMKKLFAVITQNIDNLHEDAGNVNVLEVHGNLFRSRCVSCNQRRSLNKDEFLNGARDVLEDRDNFSLQRVIEIMPRCSCGGLTRPDVVMFGEAVQRLEESYDAASRCDLMLVLGTSGAVYPAAALPHQAKQEGARLIEINPSENSYAGITDVYIKEPSGEAMPKVMDSLIKLMAH